MAIDRRSVIRGMGASTIALAGAAHAEAPQPRVVIVGAGMAGLAAAHVLANRRIPFVVLEARDRIGGRAFTDWKSLNVPFDQGCACLHMPRLNPLAAKAAERGYAVSQTPLRPAIAFGGELQGSVAVKAYDAAYGELVRAISVAGAHGDDIAVSGLINVRSVWDRLAAFAVGPEQTGVSLNQLSTLDWYGQLAANTGREGMVKAGLGSMVAAFGSDVPVTLSNPVTRVDWRGPTVRVETGNASVEADCCLLTVPLGVLRAGSIGFVPALPPEKRAAIAGIGIGVANKIALAFRPGVLPPDKDVWLYQLRKDGAIADVLVRPFGYDMTLHHTGGDFAREVELLNKADQIQLALTSIGDLYGSDVAAGCTGGAVTRWGRDPFSLGSLSAALPGQGHQRVELARPLAGRLFFAGEACAATWASSLAGAFLSGRAAARAIAERLGFTSPAGAPAPSSHL